MKKWILFCLVMILASCGGAQQSVVTFEVEDESVRLAQAEASLRSGHYHGFRSAVRIYGELYAQRSLRAKTSSPYLQACLLLALREKDLGIDNPSTLETAGRLIEENPSLIGYAPAAVLVSAIPLRTKGVMRDIDPASWDKARKDSVAAAADELLRRSRSDEFSAYVFSSWSCSFGRYSDEWRDPSELQKNFPESILLKYKAATCGDINSELLEEILDQNPDFAEARFHLGEKALAERRLFEAEEHMRQALQSIPESPQPRILLAGIFFATEEFEKSLKYYDLTLAISPEYRDALLGKAICLGYLKRHDESIEALEEMVSLGYWLIGEAHYWLAWNLHELKRDPEALAHIDEAKGRLPDNPQVWGLGGTIAAETNDFGRAETDYLEALKFAPADSESMFGLGTVHTRQGNWKAAGEYFEKAGRSFEAEAAALKAAADELLDSALPEDRKTLLVQRRHSQLERIRLAGATSFYSAAAAYLNAGMKDEAVRSAEKSASHPSLKEKSEELLRSVRK